MNISGTIHANKLMKKRVAASRDSLLPVPKLSKEKFSMFNLLIEGGLLGAATGASCAAFCLPVLIGVTVRDMNKSAGIKNTLLFIGGRFIIYSSVAVFFSLIGHAFRDDVFIRNGLMAVIGVFLIIWGIRGFINSDKAGACKAARYPKLIPFLMGIMTGLAPCPPFIAGITRVLYIGNLTGGIIYFMGFFIITSFFLLPAALLELSRFKTGLKIASSVISVAAGVFMITAGVYTIVMNVG